MHFSVYNHWPLCDPRMALLDQQPLQGGMEEGLAEQVFRIKLILEMIVNHAIRKDNGQVCDSALASLRLVQKSWLETITKLLHMSKEPLFKLRLTWRNSLTTFVGKEGKLLECFVSTVSTVPTVPTFSAVISASVLRKENHSNLSSMFVECGAGLVALEMRIPPQGFESPGTLKFLFPSFSLPSLRKLVIDLAGMETPANQPSSVDNVSHFTNYLLNVAPGLTQFVVMSHGLIDIDKLPLSYQFFTLPPSITTLTLACDMTSENLKLLVKSSLPALTSLTFFIRTDNAYPDGTLFEILDNFRKTLRHLKLSGKRYMSNRPRSVTMLHFPVMENLHEFSNLSINCELKPKITSLEKCLPKLARLTLTNQTGDMFRKWTDAGKFATVEQLKLHLANEAVSYGDHEFGLGVNLERMQSVHITFPNVNILEVTVSGATACGLKYLFLNMKQLTVLSIYVVGIINAEFEWDFWDALLIGTPVKFVAALRESPEYSQGLQFNNDRFPAIRNLQELRSLCLQTNELGRSFEDPLISDLTFHFALLKMPKLKDLTLRGRFAFPEPIGVEEKWRDQGRKLDNSFIE